MKIDWGASLQIAAVYVGTVVGAGFATGKEIVEFFSQYGAIGFFGILMSGYIFICLGSKIMQISARIQATSYQDLNIYLFGKAFGTVVNAFMLIMLLGVCAVMLSGAGAIVEEQLGFSKYVGVFMTIGLSIIVMVLGTKGLFAVNTLVVPMMIVFSFLLLLLTMQSPYFVDHILTYTYTEIGWKALASPFSYASLNLVLAQAVLVPIASEIKSEKTVIWGGIIGGLVLTLILIASHLTLVNLADFTAYEIPMATIMKTTATSLFWIYVLVIYGEIFTTIIGNVFGIERQVRKYLPIPSIFIIILIFIICYFISLIKYGTLLSYLYPLFGYLSLIFLILLWRKPVYKNQ